MLKTTRYIFLLILPVLLIIGCAAKKDAPIKESGLTIPEAWAWAAASAPVEPWLSDFRSSALEAIVIEALSGNYDLRATVARMEAARASARIKGADRLPQFSASYGATKTDAGDSLSTLSGSYMDLGLTLAWELDVWGKLRNRARASYYDYKATKAAVRGARLSLAVNVARRYFDLIEADKEVALMALNYDSFQRSLLVTEEGFTGGVYNAKELRLMRAAAATAESSYKKSRASSALRLTTLEVLLGRTPRFKLQTEADFPDISTTTAAGLPSGLIRRRPDIIEAEMRLAAADETLADKKKGFLPDITLTGSADGSSNTFDELFDPDYIIAKLIGSATQPIFKGGSIRAEKERAIAKRKEALAIYGGAVLKAFKEVEAALSAEAYLFEQEVADGLSAIETERAELIVKKDYEDGLVNIVELLEAERRTYQSRLALIKTRNRRLQSRLGLYLALGGDIHEAEETVSLDIKKRITQ